MSKESHIRIRDQWLAFEDLELPSGFTTFDLEELVTRHRSVSRSKSSYRKDAPSQNLISIRMRMSKSSVLF